MDEAGTLQPTGTIGEVVIRGRNVTAGYENNPAANAAAFVDGWFRTSDQGMLDADGYLRLTGRLKELINRGGEKVSPLEVDEVLMDHPAVAQCLTFALPHTNLGEEVAAAIVLREGLAAKETELRAFCGTRLAAFKVPRRIVFLTEIPKGATGKLQRIGLAEKLGLTE
jgi:acyl-CoA synthetase (AMP-forming)/AMP-acid ligase II